MNVLFLLEYCHFVIISAVVVKIPDEYGIDLPEKLCVFMFLKEPKKCMGMLSYSFHYIPAYNVLLLFLIRI